MILRSACLMVLMVFAQKNICADVPSKCRYLMKLRKFDSLFARSMFDIWALDIVLIGVKKSALSDRSITFIALFSYESYFYIVCCLHLSLLSFPGVQLCNEGTQRRQNQYL